MLHSLHNKERAETEARKKENMKYAQVTISKKRTTFVLNRTTKPQGDDSRSWKVLSRIATGGSPKELAEKAKAMGLTLISEPSEASVYFMKGDERRDWNGNIIVEAK